MSYQSLIATLLRPLEDSINELVGRGTPLMREDGASGLSRGGKWRGDQNGDKGKTNEIKGRDTEWMCMIE